PFSPIISPKILIPMFIIVESGRTAEHCQCLLKLPLMKEDHSLRDTCRLMISSCDGFEMMERVWTRRRLTHQRPFSCPQDKVLRPGKEDVCRGQFITAREAGDGLCQIFEPEMSTSSLKLDTCGSWMFRCDFQQTIPVGKRFPVVSQLQIN